MRCDLGPWPVKGYPNAEKGSITLEPLKVKNHKDEILVFWQFCPPHFGGIIFCTIDHRQTETETRFRFRLSNNGNGYVFLFWRQMDMETETCFRFIIP
jgi:hypothetical protein